MSAVNHLDAHLLDRAGRLWQVPLAIRELRLEQLRWDGFVVDVAGLRTVTDPELGGIGGSSVAQERRHEATHHKG